MTGHADKRSAAASQYADQATTDGSPGKVTSTSRVYGGQSLPASQDVPGDSTAGDPRPSIDDDWNSLFALHSESEGAAESNEQALAISTANAGAAGAASSKRPALKTENAVMTVRAYDRFGALKPRAEWKGLAFYYGGLPAAFMWDGKKWSPSGGKDLKIGSDATGTSGVSVLAWAKGAPFITVTLSARGKSHESLSGKPKINMPPTTIGGENKKARKGTNTNQDTNSGSTNGDGTGEHGQPGGSPDGGKTGHLDGTGVQGNRGTGTGRGGDTAKNKPGTSKRGRTDGSTTGRTKPSWADNENAETDKQGGRTPGDHGKKGGSAGGEVGSKGKGYAGAGALWGGLLDSGGTLGALVAVGLIVSDANLGLTGKSWIKVVRKRFKGIGPAPIAKQIWEEAERIAARQMQDVEKNLRKLKKFQKLSPAEQKAKLARIKYNLTRRRVRNLRREVDAEIAAYRGDIRKLKKKNDKVSRWLEKQLNENLKAAEKVRKALNIAGPAQGKGSFKKLHGGKNRNSAHRRHRGSSRLRSQQRLKRFLSRWGKRKQVLSARRPHRSEARQLQRRNEPFADAAWQGADRPRRERATAPSPEPGEQRACGRDQPRATRQVHGQIHINKAPKDKSITHPGQKSPADYPTGIDRDAFDSWKAQYWKQRAKDFSK